MCISLFKFWVNILSIDIMASTLLLTRTVIKEAILNFTSLSRLHTVLRLRSTTVYYSENVGNEMIKNEVTIEK